jgi:hypothetical protein
VIPHAVGQGVVQRLIGSTPRKFNFAELRRAAGFSG